MQGPSKAHFTSTFPTFTPAVIKQDVGGTIIDVTHVCVVTNAGYILEQAKHDSSSPTYATSSSLTYDDAVFTFGPAPPAVQTDVPTPPDVIEVSVAATSDTVVNKYDGGTLVCELGQPSTKSCSFDLEIKVASVNDTLTDQT